MSLVTLNQYGHTELFRSIFEKDTDQALTLIENNTDLDQTDINGFSPLMYATRLRLKKVTKCLIVKGCDVNIQNNNKETALHLIIKCFYRNPKAKRDWIKFLRLLIKNGADVNIKDNRDFSPIMWAIKHGQYQTVKKLINAGADINTFNDRQEWCLHLAVKSKTPETNILKLLLSNGADVNVKDRHEFSPLMWALKNDTNDIVEMLLKTGAKIDFDNPYFYKSLQLSITSQNLNMKMMEYLLGITGADVNIVDCEQKTLIIQAIQAFMKNSETKFERKIDDENDLENVVKALIEKGCNVNTVDKENKTALWYAFELRSIRILYMLLENGADPNIGFLKEFHNIHAFGNNSISTANKLTALIKYGLRTDTLPYHDKYPGLLCYFLMKIKYIFDDIPYLFDILYLSGSCSQKQLRLLLQDPWMELDFQFDCKKHKWMLEKCSQPLSLKEISRIEVLKNRKENIMSTFVKDLPINLREYLKFSEFTIDTRQITDDFISKSNFEKLKMGSVSFYEFLTLCDRTLSIRSLWEEFSSDINI